MYIAIGLLIAAGFLVVFPPWATGNEVTIHAEDHYLSITITGSNCVSVTGGSWGMLAGER